MKADLAKQMELDRFGDTKLIVRLSDRQRDVIRKAAQLKGENVSSWLRVVAVRTALRELNAA